MAETKDDTGINRAVREWGKRVMVPHMKRMIQRQSVLTADMELSIFNARRHLELAEKSLAEAKTHLGTMILEVDAMENPPDVGTAP